MKIRKIEILIGEHIAEITVKMPKYRKEEHYTSGNTGVEIIGTLERIFGMNYKDIQESYAISIMEKTPGMEEAETIKQYMEKEKITRQGVYWRKKRGLIDIITIGNFAYVKKKKNFP